MFISNITRMQLADIAEQGVLRSDGAIGIKDLKYDADVIAKLESDKLVKHLMGNAYIISTEVVTNTGIACYAKKK